MSEQGSETIIHNGEVINANPAVKTETAPAPSAAAKPGSRVAPPELDPDKIAQVMAKCVSDLLATSPKPTPMDIVNGLLQLAPAGKKLVWTRFDVYQCFGKFASKLSGETRV